jgi:hypothetical protein
MRSNPQQVDYKTHILIGVRANGMMTVIADWPHVPKQGRRPERNCDSARRLRDIRPVHADRDHSNRRTWRRRGTPIFWFFPSLMNPTGARLLGEP